MANSRNKIVRSLKPFYIVFFCAIVAGILMDSSFTLWTALIAGGFLIYLFQMKIGLTFDSFFEAKKSLFEIVIVALCASAAFSWLLVAATDAIEAEASYDYNYIGIFLMIISLLAIKLTDKFHVKKAAEDYPIMKQERMYDDILMELDEAFKDRLDSKGKTVDLSGLDMEVVTQGKDLKEEYLLEIQDIINYNVKAKPFLPYFLTALETEDDVDKYIEELERPILDKYETNKFARYLYQLLLKKLKELAKDEKNFSLRKKIYEFDGIAEYALIDMYIYISKSKNVPMGNMLAYASPVTDTMYSRHLYGCFNSISIKSIGRYGIAFYVGYYMFLEGNRIKKKQEVKDITEQFDVYTNDIYLQDNDTIKEYLNDKEIEI